MKLCEKHLDQLTGDGECIMCEKVGLHNVIFQTAMDRNLGNAVIEQQKKEIKELKAQIEDLRKQLKQTHQISQQ
jgi:hypothetical protein